jgi:hypothetical protein
MDTDAAEANHPTPRRPRTAGRGCPPLLEELRTDREADQDRSSSPSPQALPLPGVLLSLDGIGSAGRGARCADVISSWTLIGRPNDFAEFLTRQV